LKNSSIKNFLFFHKKLKKNKLYLLFSKIKKLFKKKQKKKMIYTIILQLTTISILIKKSFQTNCDWKCKYCQNDICL
jgi:hypothetical protein